MVDKQQSIEDAYKELQKIVEEFESEEVNLETSIPKFKRGLQLAAMLKKKLGAMKNEVEEIKEKFEDTINTPPDESQEEEDKVEDDL